MEKFNYRILNNNNKNYLFNYFKIKKSYQIKVNYNKIQFKRKLFLKYFKKWKYKFR